MTRQVEHERARAWVEIDLGALRRNAERIARQSGVPILPMIKADAYGLGAVHAARALEPLDPWGYGVATVDEGVALRTAGIARRIVVFTSLLGTDLELARQASLTPALGRRDAIAEWARTGEPWHLSIDTGMGRTGVRWDEVGALGDLLRQSPPEGAYTHFHSAGRPDGSARAQEERFEAALAALPARPRVLHTENGVAAERRPRSRWSLVRPGIFLYGVSFEGALVEAEPVVHVRARVVELRTRHDGETVSYDATWRAVGTRRVATLAIGYADGYRRALSNRGIALIGGRRTPVAGLVTMDMTMVDVTDVPCAVGDVATLVGRDGGAQLTVSEVAREADVSPYELLTGLRTRMPHLHLEDVP